MVIKFHKDMFLSVGVSILLLFSWFFPNIWLGYLYLTAICVASMMNIKMPAKLLVIQYVYALTVQYFISVVQLPAYTTFLTDLLLYVLSIHLVRHSNHFITSHSKMLLNMCIIFSFFCIFGLIGNILNSPNIILYLWSLRNIGRIVVFFLLSIYFLDEFTINRIWKSTNIFTITNLMLIFCQFTAGYKQDWLGGIFGITQGIANNYLNAFLIVIFCFSLSKFFNGDISILKFLIFISYILIISALAELKFMFFELIFIGVIAFLVKKVSYKFILKSFLTLVATYIIFLFSMQVFLGIFPHFRDKLDFISILEAGYSADGRALSSLTIGRLNFLSYVHDRIFNGDIIKTLFGIGMGNAERSNSIAILTSDFSRVYDFTLYHWYSSAWMLIENGLLGIMLYLFLFVYYAKKLLRCIDSDTNALASFLLIAAIPLLFIYNTSLRIEIGYVFVMYLSLGSLSLKSGDVYEV